jgi:hypothetical protein
MKTTKKPTKADLIWTASDKKIKMQTREMTLVSAINKYKINTGYVVKTLMDEKLIIEVLKVYGRICEKGLLN